MSTAPATEEYGNRILIADDDADLLALIGFTVRNAGFDAVTVRDGTSALRSFAEQKFALLVLDINMPGADGFTVCETIRAQSTLPVIMLSARSQENDIVRALEIGADDYLTKPFSPRTLLARMRAILRRSSGNTPAIFEASGVVLNIESHRLQSGDTTVQLTPLETSVLQLLMTHPGRVVSTENLVTGAWGRSGPEERQALKQVVYRLRRKLDEQTSFANLLQTTRSAGYRWGIAA